MRPRLCALGALFAVALITLFELAEFRGALAYARFLRLRRVTEERLSSEQLQTVLGGALSEADLVLATAGRNPEAAWTVASSCIDWSGRRELAPLLRLRLAQTALHASVLAMRAAPTDYENWTQLADALSALGLSDLAALCRNRAAQLAPPAARTGRSYRTPPRILFSRRLMPEEPLQ